MSRRNFSGHIIIVTTISRMFTSVRCSVVWLGIDSASGLYNCPLSLHTALFMYAYRLESSELQQFERFHRIFVSYALIIVANVSL